MMNTKIDSMREMILNGSFTKKVKDTVLTLTFNEVDDLFKGLVHEYNSLVKEHNSSNNKAGSSCHETDEYKALRADVEKKLDALNGFVSKYNEAMNIYKSKYNEADDKLRVAIAKSIDEKMKESEKSNNYFVDVTDEMDASICSHSMIEATIDSETKNAYEEAKSKYNDLKNEYEKAGLKLRSFTESFKDNSRVNKLETLSAAIKKLKKFIMANYSKFAA